MAHELQKYKFDAAHSITLLFLPGYTKGLSAPIIEALKNHYVTRPGLDVLGFDPDFASDTIDDFHQSLERIRLAISDFKKHFPSKKILLIAKSLSGALCLHDLDNLTISGIVVLGSSLALGWPQRISLLDTENRVSYASGWSETISRITLPVYIISGDEDDLADNEFLKHAAQTNDNIHLHLVPRATHSLKNIDSHQLCTEICEQVIDTMIGQMN